MSLQGSRKYTPRQPREVRREQILDATLRLVARDGWGALKMDRVAKEAEIAKSVVYAIFDSQEGLQHALMTRERERSFELASRTLEELGGNGNPVAAAVGALTVFLNGVAEAPDTWRLVLLPMQGAPEPVVDAVLEGRERWRAEIEPIVSGLLGEAESEGLDLELVAHLARGNAEYFARLILDEPEHFTLERIGAFIADVGARLSMVLSPPETG